MQKKRPFGLAIEVIGRDGSVALMEGRSVVAARHLDTQARAASTLIPAIKELLRQSPQTVLSPDYVAVAIGPGSFTGLRIAVTSAKTLAFAWDVPLVAVDSLAAIAESAAFARLSSASSQADSMDSVDRYNVLAGLTAYRGQTFRGQFVVSRAGSGELELKEIEPVGLLSTADWQSELAAITSPPDSSSAWIFAGDRIAFERRGAGFERFGPVTIADDSDPVGSRAAGVGRIGAKIWMTGASSGGKMVSPLDAVPDYFRPSAAEEKSAAS